MARKRKRSSKCQITTICGKRRRICRDAKGLIKSNTPASGGKKKRKISKRGKRKRAAAIKCTTRRVTGAGNRRRCVETCRRGRKVVSHQRLPMGECG